MDSSDIHDPLRNSVCSVLDALASDLDHLIQRLARSELRNHTLQVLLHSRLHHLSIQPSGIGVPEGMGHLVRNPPELDHQFGGGYGASCSGPGSANVGDRACGGTSSPHG
jgi:hypothetical protein